ncbi:Rz1-like lysis system protein LysC [Phocoenobacter uteri]|uniref:Rz1-like lysis system protein LysC n=1 Tax=Phocoenobacter uteri TaxID=146806 RepID=UPI003C730B3B
MLVACSTPKTTITEINQAQQMPILCPTTPVCRMPLLSFQTNKDLAIGVETLMNNLSFCVVKIEAMENCITQYNENLKSKEQQ